MVGRMKPQNCFKRGTPPLPWGPQIVLACDHTSPPGLRRTCMLAQPCGQDCLGGVVRKRAGALTSVSSSLKETQP